MIPCLFEIFLTLFMLHNCQLKHSGLKNRFEEYPKLRELIIKKDQLIQQTNTAPMYLKCDLETFKLADLKCKFDVILLEPPLEEYQGVHDKNYKHWSWKQVLHGLASAACFNYLSAESKLKTLKTFLSISILCNLIALRSASEAFTLVLNDHLPDREPGNRADCLESFLLVDVVWLEQWP